MSDSESDTDGPAQNPADVESKKSMQIIEDLTGEDDLLSESQSSLASLNLSDGTPSVKPRSYQTEMFEESLKHNIIFVAATGSGKTHM